MVSTSFDGTSFDGTQWLDSPLTLSLCHGGEREKALVGCGEQTALFGELPTAHFDRSLLDRCR